MVYNWPFRSFIKQQGGAIEGFTTMSTQLTEHLFNDLVTLSDINQNYVPSEETIRFMLYAFNSMYNLKADLVHRDQLALHIDNLIKHYKPAQGTVRYQVLVETGARGIAKQGDKGNIHYAALDLLLMADGTKKCFFADYLNGDSVSLAPLESCVKKYNIALYKAGGKNEQEKKIIMQADDYHCPIFSIEFLLKIINLDIYNTIDSIADENRVVSWLHLPPPLVWNSQSVSFLFNYVDHLQQVRKSPEKDDPKLTTELDIHGNTFRDFVALGLIKNTDGKSKYYEKIQNNAIKFTARLLCRAAWAYCLKQKLTDTTLLYIFYKPHQKIYDLLNKYKDTSCLIPFVFYNVGFWNLCLKNKQFETLFTHEKFIYLLQLNIININDLLKLIAPFYVTDANAVGFDKNTSLNSNVINTISKNMAAIDIIMKNYKLMPDNNKPQLLKILTKTTTSYLLNLPVIAKLVAEHPLNIMQLLETPLAKIDFHRLNNLQDEDKITYLKILGQPITPTRRTPNASPSRSNQKRAATTSHSDDESSVVTQLLFDVPDADEVETRHIPQIAELPENENISPIAVSQARLLAQSMPFISDSSAMERNSNTVKDVTNLVKVFNK